MDPYLLPHLEDLRRAAERQCRTVGSAFLAPAEALAAKEAFEGKAPFALDGGYEGAERQRAFFFPLGEEIESDTRCVHIEAKGKRFAASLTHRDYLGAILGQGIERGAIGDLVTLDGEAYAFCLPSVLPSLLALESIGRFPVSVSEVDPSSFPAPKPLGEKRVTLASYRLDAWVAEAFSLSREEAKKAILAGIVAQNGVPCLRPDGAIKEGDKIALRGKGKIAVLEFLGTSRKGKEAVRIGIYR